jgi:putative membrane protein
MRPVRRLAPSHLVLPVVVLRFGEGGSPAKQRTAGEIMRRSIIHLIVVTFALGVAAWLLPGVQVESVGGLLVGGLALAIVNAWVRPVMNFGAFPVSVLTLGLFLFVVNGLAFALASWMVPGFTVASFWWAILGSVVVSVLSYFLAGGKEDAREKAEKD